MGGETEKGSRGSKERSSEGKDRDGGVKEGGWQKTQRREEVGKRNVEQVKGTEK